MWWFKTSLLKENCLWGRCKKTNNSAFSVTHTYIKLTLVRFFFTFFFYAPSTKILPFHNKLLLCVCAKYGPAKSSSDFRISLSPKQFISNQRPFSSFRAFRRSFKCNLVFGGFSYLPSAASAPGQPRQFQRYFQSIVFFPL